MDVPMRNEIEKMLAAQKVELLAALESSGKAVKSVQYQYISAKAASKALTISEVNVEKAVVHISGWTNMNGHAPYISDRTSTTVTVSNAYGSNATMYASIFVVEYY